MQQANQKERIGFCDSGDAYRIKFRLSDGRHVYARDRDAFAIVDKDWLPLLEQFVRSWAYDPCLRIFTERDFFEAFDEQCLLIVETTLEPAHSPIDPSAFVLEGMLAVDFANLNGNAFAA